MSVDLSDPAAVRREAERRRKLRDAGALTFDDSNFSTSLDVEKREPPRERVTRREQSGNREQKVIARIIGPIEHPVRAIRWIDGLQAKIAGPPRTKKNSKEHYTRQSQGYRVYRDRVVNGFLPLLAGLELPLADRDYNLRATFYVDTKGEQADLVGLIQGLADALENAGVVSNDRWFRGFDRSRMIAGDKAPRVELLISPLDA